MRKGSTIFLQVVLIVIAVGALALILWEPHLEGRNINATLSQIYFNDPFLAYVYIGSIPFFMALFQSFILLGYIRKNKVFSSESVRALRTIKYCAITIVGFIVGAEAWVFAVQRGKEDIAGGVAVGILIMFISAVVATAAAVFEKLLQSAIDIKSENDLTV